MGDLHPIVIPAMEGTYKSIKFTCSGEGLYKDGFLYDPQAVNLIPPKNAKAGSEPKEKKSLSYWKAQCAFRGLNQTGAIADLQTRLREAKKKILPEIKAMENELNKAFKKKNKAARDDSWTSLKSAEQKAKADPKKYLAEAFPKSGSGRPANLDIVVLKLGSDARLAVADAAEAVGLEYVSVDAPWTSNKKPDLDRWSIIGRTRDAVWNQMRDIKREAGRSKETYAAEKSKPKPAKLAQPAKLVEPKKSIAKESKATSHVRPTEQGIKPTSSNAVQRARSPLRIGLMPKSKGGQMLQTGSKTANPEPASGEEDRKLKATKNGWDVAGRYTIRCPAIENNWEGYDSEPLTLDMYLETRNGKRQLFGAFDFRIIEGIMRFEKPAPVPKIEKESESSKKRKIEDLDEDGDTRMDLYPDMTSSEGRSAYLESGFYLAANDRPTARRPVWRYRWRGKETGEAEIQLGSDEVVQSITFSEKGNKISGSFICEYLKECRFTGTKVSTSTHNGDLNPRLEWEEHSSDAYEDATVSRW